MSLVEYVAAIEGLTSAKMIVGSSVPVIEQVDESLSATEQYFRFSDGTVIAKQSEMDSEERAECDQVCEEVWLKYQVATQPQAETIVPTQKSFTNRCQQSFWIKMQRQQAGAF